MRAYLLRHFVAAVGVIGLACYTATYAMQPSRTPIRSDGFSYHVYLPSWFIYHDVTLASVANDCCGGAYPGFTGIGRWPGTGRWMNAHPIGVAVLSAPFFAIADALTWWSNLPRDGLSLYYQHGAGLAGLAYLLAGLATLRAVLRRHVGDGIALATLVTITFGTNLLHYGINEPTHSHAFSFCLVCGLVAVTERWWESPTVRRSTALGLVAGLIVLVRQANALILLLVPLYGLTTWRGVAAHGAELWRRRGSVLLAAVVCAVCVAPQLVLYRQVTGSWLVFSYAHLGPRWAWPRLFDVLFSVQKGLFFWSPVLLGAVAGFACATGWFARWRVGVGAVLVITTCLVATWSDWQFGASYGHRAFTDALGLFAICLAACYSWLAGRPRLARAAGPVVSLLVLLSMVQMLQYWLGIIPEQDTTWAQYRALFMRF